MELLGYFPPTVHVKEVVSTPLISCCLLTRSHARCPRYPHSFLLVVPTLNTSAPEDSTPAVIPPVPVVEFSGCRQLQHVPHIRVEHVEQNIILVPVQLYWRQLFPRIKYELNKLNSIG